MDKILNKNDFILEFKNISKKFPGVQALKDVSFGIRRGCIHCIVGENGAGKSTLLNVIDGLIKPDSGSIYFNGEPWGPADSLQASRGGISMIHQELNIIPEMTILENIFLGKEKMKKNRLILDEKEMMKEASTFIKQQELSFNLKAKMKDLSIAEAQLIEILKAISSNAKLVMMDEPTSSITEKEVEFLFKKIYEMKKNGITILYISHKMEEVFKLADYISVFRDGTHIDTKPTSDFTRSAVIEKMVGRKMSEVYPKRNPHTQEVVLKVENFNKKGVFSDINFEAHKGEILGFAGLIGAGRTEIARSIIGLDSKDTGDIYCEGKKIQIKSVNDAVANGISMISEDRRKYGLVLKRNVKENISIVALTHVFKSLFIKSKKELKMVKDIAEMLSIKTPSLDTNVSTLSGGNQQKVALAKWMVVSPKVLIMDEPTRGIDVGTKYEIYKLMNQMTDNGMSIILIDSDMEELLGMSDRIIVVREGRIMGEFNRKDVKVESIISLAVGGNV